MVNRPARVPVADITRALLAANRMGLDYIVEIAPDGTIRISQGTGGTGQWIVPEPEEETIL